MKSDVSFAVGAIVIAILLAGATIAWGVYHSGGTVNNGSMITITATGSASTSGGQASIYLYANGSGSSSQLAIANLSNTLTSVNSTLLKYINGNLSRITTQYFNVNKAYNKSVYVAYENILVTIPNAQNATGTLVSLSAIPNVYVSNIAPKLSDQQISTLRSQALSIAMANATSQATTVSPTGRAIVVNISVNSYYVYPMPYNFGGGVATPAVAVKQISSSLFYSGTSTVTESVSVVFRTT
jgi:uncharacterized protein YggE